VSVHINPRENFNQRRRGCAVERNQCPKTADSLLCTAGLGAWFDAASDAVEVVNRLSSSQHELPIDSDRRAVQIFLGKSGAKHDSIFTPSYPQL
jgi:hypothetical protein